MQNPVLSDAVLTLKGAYRKSKAPIWLRTAEMLQRPASRSIEVNLSRINRYTKTGGVVVVPGKVLGSGNIEQKITLCAFSISESAAKKVTAAGGRVLGIKELVEKFPEGSGVTIIA